MTHPLDGTWFNRLGSRMDVVANADGSLHGRYQSTVGDAAGWYVLNGRFDTNPPLGGGRSLGWTVNWRNAPNQNAHSTTTWCGQYFPNPPRILAQWLLTRSTDTQNVWASTNVGRDDFHRSPPTAEIIRKALECNEGSKFPPVHEDPNDGPEFETDVATSDTN